MSNKHPQPKPDFNTDVLWKPIRMSNRLRTTSTDSTSSQSSESTGRRFSISEMLGGPFIHRQSSLSSETGDLPPRKSSLLTENVDFQEFMRRQNRILSEQ